ncbi:MAG TPA: spore coat U domain-containing protein [Vicinamibacterales bacterium]|nr:spore coat U domain-containing protein [Vicinamibacterales bacterium]
MSPRARRRRAPAIAAVLLTAVAWPAALHAACTVSVQGGVSFGTYNVFAAAPLDTTGSISYRCDKADHDIRVTISRGASGTFRPRTLVNGTERLEYNLFMDAARTQIWGDQTEGTTCYFRHNPQNNRWIDLVIYARIPPGQDAPAGSYTDTITVDINF